jgi:hypothetical protein
MIIGAVAGGVGGCLLGELILGQQLDFPHGPDMLIGAGIGAALGTWAGSAAHRNSVSTAAPAPKKKGLSVIPVVSSKTKAVIVSFPLK